MGRKWCAAIDLDGEGDSGEEMVCAAMDLVGEGEEAVIGDPDRPEEELESEERRLGQGSGFEIRGCGIKWILGLVLFLSVFGGWGLGQRVEGPVLLMKAGGGKTWVGKELEYVVFNCRIFLESVRGDGTKKREGESLDDTGGHYSMDLAKRLGCGCSFLGVGRGWDVF